MNFVLLVSSLMVCCRFLHAVIVPSQTRPPVTPSPSSDTLMNSDETPEGYYAFIEASNVEPPQVRPPPYFRSDRLCLGLMQPNPIKSLKNLCGDLNKGFIPLNPMRQNVLGSPYPFDLVKNKTLEFFSKTLPILQVDETLPKVTKFQTRVHNYYKNYENDVNTSQLLVAVGRWGSTTSDHRTKREDRLQQSFHILKGIVTGQEDVVNSTKRIARKFCEHGGGVLCMLYRAVQGESLAMGSIERRDDDLPELRIKGDNGGSSLPHDGPPTPCPAKVEYATPVFARNYQGVWRYVVQIPYEGYFTQTVEVTRCMQSKCYYMDGGCLSSPRWVSLLVAEIYYPEAFLPSSGIPTVPRSPVQGEEPPTSFLHKAGHPAESASTNTHITKPPQCDGVDELGCFQVRLYYDWFLIPGSCKCWRPEYFSKYIRRKPNYDL